MCGYIYFSRELTTGRSEIPVTQEEAYHPVASSGLKRWYIYNRSEWGCKQEAVIPKWFSPPSNTTKVRANMKGGLTCVRSIPLIWTHTHCQSILLFFQGWYIVHWTLRKYVISFRFVLSTSCVISADCNAGRDGWGQRATTLQPLSCHVLWKSCLSLLRTHSFLVGASLTIVTWNAKLSLFARGKSGFLNENSSDMFRNISYRTVCHFCQQNICADSDPMTDGSMCVTAGGHSYKTETEKLKIRKLFSSCTEEWEESLPPYFNLSLSPPIPILFSEKFTRTFFCVLVLVYSLVWVPWWHSSCTSMDKVAVTPTSFTPFLARPPLCHTFSWLYWWHNIVIGLL